MLTNRIMEDILGDINKARVRLRDKEGLCMGPEKGDYKNLQHGREEGGW